MDKCPECGKEVNVVEGNWGLHLVYCKFCGWEKERRVKEKKQRKTKGRESSWNLTCL